jgi:hypothetical protein
MSKRSVVAGTFIALSAGLATLHAQESETSPSRCGADYLSLARNKGYEVLVEALVTDPEITKAQNREVRIFFEFDKSDNTFGFIAKGPKQQCNLIEGSNWKWGASLPGVASDMPSRPPKSLHALRDEFDAFVDKLSRQYGENIIGIGERGVGGEKANRVVFFANPTTATWTIAEVVPTGNFANAVAFGTLYSRKQLKD